MSDVSYEFQLPEYLAGYNSHTAQLAKTSSCCAYCDKLLNGGKAILVQNESGETVAVHTTKKCMDGRSGHPRDERRVFEALVRQISIEEPVVAAAIC